MDHAAVQCRAKRRTLLGFGQSEQRCDQRVGLGDQARLLVELLRAWQVDSPAIVAHDAGAAIAGSMPLPAAGTGVADRVPTALLTLA